MTFLSQSQHLLCLFFQFIVEFSDTHALWPVFSHCANKSLNPALKLNVWLLLCVATVNTGNHVKSIMLIIIIITDAPWHLEVPMHYIPPCVFPAGLFSLQASSSPAAMDPWSCSQQRPVVLFVWSLFFNLVVKPSTIQTSSYHLGQLEEEPSQGDFLLLFSSVNVQKRESDCMSEPHNGSDN